MRCSSLFTVGLGLLALVAAGDGAEAASIQKHYYASGPAVVSNYPADDRPILNLGSMTLDPSKAPGGDLRNLEVHSFQSGIGPGDFLNAEVVTHIDFSLGVFGGGLAPIVNYDLRFDEAGRLSHWHFSPAQLKGDSLDRPWTVTGGSDSYRRENPILSPSFNADLVARDFLAGLGWPEESARWRELYCGSWTGQSCAETGGEASQHWLTEFLSPEGGIWTTDLREYGSLVQARIAEGLANPPASYHDIAPVPVPAPVLLLLGGLAGLALVGRRRAA